MRRSATLSFVLPFLGMSKIPKIPGNSNGRTRRRSNAEHGNEKMRAGHLLKVAGEQETADLLLPSPYEGERMLILSEATFRTLGLLLENASESLRA